MAQTYPDMQSMSLFSSLGERKYISETERTRFLSALNILDTPSDRTYCEMIFWTGCRPSEALQLTRAQIDLDERTVIIRSLKKHSEQKDKHFRCIPLPTSFIKRLDRVHGLRRTTLNNSSSQKRLWRFCRTTAWRRIRKVMQAAEIVGIRATGRGLRHSYGVHAVVSDIPETRIQKWLGHASLKTTAIYLNAVGPEDRAIAKRMWKGI